MNYRCGQCSCGRGSCLVQVGVVYTKVIMYAPVQGQGISQWSVYDTTSLHK